MSFTGLLLQESLADRSILDRLRVTKVERWEPGEAGAPGPPVWTPTYFEGDESDADGRAAAEDYARSLGVPEHQLDWEQ